MPQREADYMKLKLRHHAGPLRDVSTDLQALLVELRRVGYDLGAIEATTAGSEEVPLTAAVPVAAGQMVTAKGLFADRLHIERGFVLGAAAQSAGVGETFSVRTAGLADVGGFTQGDVLYLDTDGALSVTVPQEGFQQRVGVALSSAAMVLLPSEPIRLT